MVEKECLFVLRTADGLEQELEHGKKISSEPLNGAAQATKGIIISITADDAMDRHSLVAEANAVLSVSCYHIVPWPIWARLDGSNAVFCLFTRRHTTSGQVVLSASGGNTYVK